MNKEDYKFLNIPTEKIGLHLEVQDDGFNSYYVVTWSLPGYREHSLEATDLVSAMKQLVSDVAEKTEWTLIGTNF